MEHILSKFNQFLFFQYKQHMYNIMDRIVRAKFCICFAAVQRLLKIFLQRRTNAQNPDTILLYCTRVRWPIFTTWRGKHVQV